MKKDQYNPLQILQNEILATLGLGRKCDHAGEAHEFCGKCGADLRVITSYECRVCSFMGRPKVYPTEMVPKYCTQCGAPKFTFIKIRKKRSTKK